jgi:hypothetical protein
MNQMSKGKEMSESVLTCNSPRYLIDFLEFFVGEFKLHNLSITSSLLRPGCTGNNHYLPAMKVD